MWMEPNFYYYDGLQPKMSAGMIKEHEYSVPVKKDIAI